MQRLFFFFVFIQGFWFKQGPHDGYDTQVWLDIIRIKDGLSMYRDRIYTMVWFRW